MILGACLLYVRTAKVPDFGSYGDVAQLDSSFESCWTEIVNKYRIANLDTYVAYTQDSRLELDIDDIGEIAKIAFEAGRNLRQGTWGRRRPRVRALCLHQN
jgi:hypothetical protein